MTGSSFATLPRAVQTFASEFFGYPNLIYLIRTPSDITSGTFMSESTLPEWEQLLSAAAHLQEILPDATLVGGTAVAIFAQHRVSRDADHVLHYSTITQMRALAGAILPGSKVKRRLLWRYTLVYQKPV